MSNMKEEELRIALATTNAEHAALEILKDTYRDSLRRMEAKSATLVNRIVSLEADLLALAPKNTDASEVSPEELQALLHEPEEPMDVMAALESLTMRPSIAAILDEEDNNDNEVNEQALAVSYVIVIEYEVYNKSLFLRRYSPETQEVITVTQISDAMTFEKRDHADQHLAHLPKSPHYIFKVQSVIL